MRILRLSNNFNNIFLQGAAVTIGNFDGVHIGHQAILKKLTKVAKKENLPSCAVIFEPQPLEFFNPLAAKSRITNLRDKVLNIKRCGVDFLLVIEFNNKIAAMSAENFISKVLVKNLKTKYIIIGADFKFGAQRQGDFNFLLNLQNKYNFKLEKAEDILLDNQRVSSSWLREVMQEANFNLMHKMLGRNYAISGHIVYGNQLGRKLGVPTANLRLKQKKLLLHGIYVGRAFGIKNYPLPGVISIGNRPTVDGKTAWLEIHFFDFHDNIYGKCIEVEFLTKLRDEKCFASLAELKEQMQIDIQRAKEF